MTLTLEGTLAAGQPTVRWQLTVSPAPVIEGSSSEFRVVPVSGGFAPGVDPNNLKQFLNDEDDERYLRSLNKAT